MVRQPSINPMKFPYLLVGLAFLLGALPPLHEMDLAQHLAMGEWIVRHGAVPFSEPFGWTREGQPYFAYSWLAQVTYFSLLDAAGPFALHLLEGAIVAGAAAAAMWSARALGWSRTTSSIIGVLNLALLWGVAPTIRPQQLLFITLPLMWGLAARVRAMGPKPAYLIGIAVVGTIAVNTHLFFPLTAVPIAYFLLTDERPRNALIAGAALLAGWLITPYVLVLPQLFALNFGHNVLLSRPPSVAEFVPGFEYAVPRTGVIIGIIALLAAPWLAPGAATLRDRVVRMLFWTAGLVLFAFAGRLVVAWWVLSFLLIGLAIEQTVPIIDTRATVKFKRLVAFAATAIVLLVSAPEINPLFWKFEGDTTTRLLPRAGEDPALWLPSWLICNTRPGAGGRVFTEFNYGSELNWRLPGYSPSIDGRTIYPDSDAVEFSFQPAGRALRHATTWQHADLALIGRSLWLAPILDKDSSWLLLAETRPSARFGVSGLWAKRAWWAKHGTTTAVPARDVRVADLRGLCAASGFPEP